MYLKRLEIDGFKSFANEINLDFTKGITAIVGPNGSGKSNILDAILWVLGEQSYKTIRAKESSDIIFSGGKNKSARSSAKVSLVIDNKDRYLDIDSDEITITRYINSDLETTYILNNEKVRLKDINNLLMDTGIGKNAYSVIGQGKVEKIVSSSSSEIRNIIDEAAGIKKAKTQKESSIKKLLNVENEIEKIEFVEKDLNRRLKHLEIECINARKYVAYNEENNVLKYMQSNYYINQYNQKLIESNSKSKEYKNSLEIENKNIEKLTNETQILLDEKQSLEQKLNLLYKSSENSKVLEELEITKEKYIQEKSDFKANITIYSQKYDELNQKLIDLKSNLDKFDEQKQISSSKLKNIKEQKSQLENEINSINKKLEILRENTKNNDDNIRNYEVDKYKLKLFIEENIKRINLANGKIKATKAEMKLANEKLEKLKDDNKQTYLKELKDKSDKLKLEIQDLKKFKYEYSEKIEQINAKYFALKNSVDNLTTTNNAVKYINKNSIDDKSVLGPFITLIDVKKQYNLAISTIANFNFYDIVVETSVDANRYVQKLKNDKIGQASFLPLDSLKLRNLDNTKYENSIYARDVVKNISKDKRVDKIINFVFNNTLIVENLENGIKISKKCPYKIVTLQGDQISNNGRITGGHVSKNVNDILLKRNELNDLEIEKVDLEKQIDKNNKILEQKYNQYLEIKKILEKEILVFEEYEKQLKQLNNQIDTFEFEIDDNNNFVDKKTIENENNEKAIEKIDIEIDKLNKLQLENTAQIQQLEKKYNDNNLLNKLNLDIVVIEKEIELIDNNYSTINSEYIELNNKFNEINEFLEKKDINSENIESKLNDIDLKIKLIKEQNIVSKDNIAKYSQKIIENTDKYSALVDNLKDNEIKKAKILNDLDNNEKEIIKYTELLEFNKQNIENLEEFRENIISNYQYKNIESLQELKMVERKISLNEKAKQDLGQVNVSAIKTYEQDKKVFDQLQNSKFDLIRSKDKINDIIFEIDNEITEKFSNAIEKIKVNFQSLCSKLLNGAKGDITLENPDDLINTGLELSVKYKNKPRQSLSLLSGGEKSMLAISFIISIFMYKPTPFTFFDEVEAALDDANTKKIISLLKDFKNSQFILITHNKETMKGADRLYGVTMNKEIGESVLVCVDI